MDNIMKKSAIILAAAAFVLAGCVKATPEPEYNQDTTLYRTGKVTLLASIEDFSTKAEIPATGHGLWKKGDCITVYTSDGTPVEFKLDGTGDTKKAKFVGEIPSGKELGNLAVYPSGIVRSRSGNSISVSIPESYTKDDNEFRGVMTAMISDSFEITFRQAMSLVSFTFSKFPANGTKLVIEEPGYSLSGEFSIDLDKEDAFIAPIKGDKGITFEVPAMTTSFSQTIPVPVAEYKGLKATVYDENGAAIVDTPLLVAYASCNRAEMKSISAEFPNVIVETPYIILKGVKWAKGNLQRDKGNSSEGFRAGWRIAPSQWMNFNYDKDKTNNGSQDYVYDEKPTAMRYSVDPDHCDHFNFGGLSNFTGINIADVATPAGDACISGKLFTDQNCAVATKDFSAAKFGDIAYWTSNGQYRMPTYEELNTLMACDATYGWVVIPEVGKRVWGILFTEPAGSSPVKKTEGREISMDELNTGLFLPFCGRHPDSNMTVINYRTQGDYWSGNAIDKALIASMSWASSASGDQYQYCDFLNMTQTALACGYETGYAYDRRSGFCIRPVAADEYNGGGGEGDEGDGPDTPDIPEPPVTGSGVSVGGTALAETSTKGIYEGTVDVAASSEFTVTIAGEEYGFLSYSGAGGIGTCKNENSSFPYYNIAIAKTSKSDYAYYAERAIGQMGKIAGANKFYTNLAAAGKMFVRINTVTKVPEYYFELVKAKDASVVFHENFDLCTCGGDYMVAIAGTKCKVTDGLEPGEKAGVTANNPSFTFDYPTAVAATELATEDYIANRGLKGWEFEYAGERPGALQLCSGSIAGHMTTPKLEALSAATDVTLTIDMSRFSTSSVDPINIIILGAGSFVSGSVSIDAYAAAGTNAASKEYSGLSGDTFSIVDDAYCPHTLANGDADKPHSVFTFKIKGATSATQIKIDAPKGAKNAPRCFVFDLKVTK